MSLLSLGIISLPTTASAQTNNACTGTGVTYNPNKFAVISPDHDSPATLQYRFEILRVSDNVPIQEYVYVKNTMIDAGSNCYLSPTFTVNPNIPRDNSTQYYSRFRVESENVNFSSEWSPKSAPFVLASKLRAGAILVSW